MTLHKARRAELRLGHNEFCVGFDSKGYKYTNISHHVLLEGLQIPLSGKSSLAHSMGPMTTKVMLQAQKGNTKLNGSLQQKEPYLTYQTRMI